MDNSIARNHFERYYKKVSRATWYRVKSVFNDRFPLNFDNIQEIALIKKAIPKLNETELKQYVDNHVNLNSRETITGEQILGYIEKSYNLRNIPSYTLSRWFRQIGGYKKNRHYNVKDVKFVSYQAFLYAKRREKI